MAVTVAVAFSVCSSVYLGSCSLLSEELDEQPSATAPRTRRGNAIRTVLDMLSP
jgi:hypothetical protein